MNAKGDDVNDGTLITPRRIVAAVALVLALVFIFQNGQTVKLNVLFFSFETRAWFGFVVTLVLGVLLGWGLSARRARKAGGSG